MAEAVVEERPPVPPRFYCHICDEEINISNSDFTCPICSGGFVEELPAAAPANAASTGSNTSSRLSAVGGANDDQQLDSLWGHIANMMATRDRNSESGSSQSARGPPRNVISLGPGLHTGGGRVRPQSMTLDSVLHFLQSISVGGGAGSDADTNPFDNSQFFFMGNLGDYAWGREGLDTIVTQLLNQIETSGPPPLPKDKIEEIPKVEISAEDVERKLQCSVCWEDFKLNEQVRKLACSHVYHEECIVPWLNLHGTCPICRKSLSGNEEEDNDVHMDVMDERPSASSNLCPLHQHRADQRRHRHGDGGQPGTSSAGASGGSSQQQQQQQQPQQPQPQQAQQQQQQSSNSNSNSDNIFGFGRMDSVDLD